MAHTGLNAEWNGAPAFNIYSDAHSCTPQSQILLRLAQHALTVRGSHCFTEAPFLQIQLEMSLNTGPLTRKAKALPLRYSPSLSLCISPRSRGHFQVFLMWTSPQHKDQSGHVSLWTRTGMQFRTAHGFTRFCLIGLCQQ